MSYDLSVQHSALPADVDARLVQALREVGVELAMLDGASLAERPEGWFPVSVRLDPARFAFPADAAWTRGPVETGFEVRIEDAETTFYAGANDTAAAWFCGAALAVLTGGELTDWQVGKHLKGSDLRALLAEVFALRWPEKRPAPCAAMRTSLVTYRAT